MPKTLQIQFGHEVIMYGFFVCTWNPKPLQKAYKGFIYAGLNQGTRAGFMPFEMSSACHAYEPLAKLSLRVPPTQF